MVVLDSLKEDEKDPSSPTLLDYLHDHRLPGSVDIRPPRGILQVFLLFVCVDVPV